MPAGAKFAAAHKRGKSGSIPEPHRWVPEEGPNAQSCKNRKPPWQGQARKKDIKMNSCCSPKAAPQARGAREIRKAAKVRPGSRRRRCSLRREDRAGRPKRSAGPSTEKPSRGRRRLEETLGGRAAFPRARGRTRLPKAAALLWTGR